MRKNKIRILHVAQAAGGVDRYIRMLLKYLDKEKFKNILVCSQDFHEKDYRGLVDSFEQVKMTRAIGGNDLKAIREVRALIKKYNPDIVYAHSSKAGAIARIADIGLKKVVTRAAQESKMLRQTHMIEKGMSLSEPRKGFGQQKIAVLFEMMDQYLKMGYPSDGMPFQDAIIVLNAYVDMQKGLGYENSAMVEKLKTYDTYRIDGLTAGIKYDTRANLMSNIDKPFPEFFYSRHSMRQFESKCLFQSHSL